MNSDTIFPILTNGEQIVRSFQHHSFCSSIEFVATLTNRRLLTRTKRTIFCCCHHSSYSAISLESIHRIDEDHARPNALLYAIFWIFGLLAAIAGILVSILILADQTIRLIVIIVPAIPLIIISITIFCLCCCAKNKFIQLHGTFGSTKILLEKEEARVFEDNLSEQISQMKIYIQQGLISNISPPTYSLRNEKQTMNYSMVTSSQF